MSVIEDKRASLLKLKERVEKEILQKKIKLQQSLLSMKAKAQLDIMKQRNQMKKEQKRWNRAHKKVD